MINRQHCKIICELIILRVRSKYTKKSKTLGITMRNMNRKEYPEKTFKRLRKYLPALDALLKKGCGYC